MKRTALLPLLLALVLPSGALAAPPAPPRLVAPAQDAVVPLLNETQRGYVLMPREERVNAYTNEAFRRALRDGGEVPAKVRFAWKGTAPEGEGPAFTVEVRRKPDGKVFFRGGTDHHHLAADGCFEIAREWEWTVRARGGASATGTFRTEDLAPRLIDGGAVPNVRDLGGRVGLGGRRVLLFRVLKCRQPGKTRINGENRDRWLSTLGVKTDVDLRSEGEVYGMEGSPLGPTVAWINVSSSAYGGMQDEGGRKAFAKVFRVFLDPANYPIDFHCIAGQDRTGAVAFILNALLGVEEEELWLDWEVTAFHNRNTDFNHGRLFDKLVRGFDRWPGETINERVEAYVLDLGFTPEEIATFREIMLEPAS